MCVAELDQHAEGALREHPDDPHTETLHGVEGTTQPHSGSDRVSQPAPETRVSPLLCDHAQQREGVQDAVR